MGKSPAGRGTNWVIHEYHPIVENPQVLGHAEVHADLPSQPLLSSDRCFPEEDVLYLSELFDDEYPKINCITHESQLEPDNSVPHQRPYIICRSEKKTDKKDATPGYDVGEPSGSGGIDNISFIENLVAPSAISEVHGHAEVNADLPSQLFLSSDWHFPEEDVLYLSDLFDDDQQINCVMDENQPEPDNYLPHKGPYVTSHFEDKINEMAGTPSCDKGEPSGTADMISATENPVAPAAISEFQAHVHTEVNSNLLSQPFLLPGDYFTEDDVLYFSDVFDDYQNINWVLDESHPELENSLPHQGPYVTSHLEDKTNEMVGTSSCDKGEPSGVTDMISATENPVAPAAIIEFQAHVHSEVNANLLSQPFLLPGDYFTEDDVLYFSDVFDDDQNINWVVDESHPELENSPPYQGPSVLSRLVYKTDEKAGIPGCYVGEPSGHITSDIGNQEAPTAIQEVHGLTEVNSEKESSMIFSNSFNYGHNMMQVRCGADELEESSAQFVDGLIVGPHENNCGETTNNLFSNSIQLKSLKRPFFPDGPAGVDRNVEGVDGRVKRSRSFALGE